MGEAVLTTEQRRRDVERLAELDTLPAAQIRASPAFAPLPPVDPTPWQYQLSPIPPDGILAHGAVGLPANRWE